MRTLTILILAFILPNTLNAQDEISDYLPFKDGKIIYSEVVQIDSTSKVELYKRAKRWLSANYDFIVLDDIDKRELHARGGSLKFIIHYNLWHEVTIQIKDGRFKYEFTNFRRKSFTVSGGSSSIKDQPLEEYSVFGKMKGMAYEKIDSQITDFIDSFIIAMNTPIDDNW